MIRNALGIVECSQPGSYGPDDYYFPYWPPVTGPFSRIEKLEDEINSIRKEIISEAEEKLKEGGVLE